MLRCASQAGKGEDVGRVDVDLYVVKWDARLEIRQTCSKTILSLDNECGLRVGIDKGRSEMLN